MEISFRDNGVGTLKKFHKTTIFDPKIVSGVSREGTGV